MLHSESPDGICANDVRDALHRVLTRERFAHCPRLSAFLSFVVEQTLAGGSGQLKEYQIGVEVFRRKECYDPKVDPIVRVEARQIRLRLQAYYKGAGRDDPIWITLPKGGYVPVFTRNPQVAASDGLVAAWLDHNWKRLAVAAAAVVLALGLWTVARHRPPKPERWQSYAQNSERLALYMKGRDFLDERTPKSIRKAISCFQQLLRTDARDAFAWAGLAYAYGVMGATDQMLPLEVMPEARAAALTALRIDPQLPEAHVALGKVKTFYDWDWKGAETEYRLAIALDPELPDAHLGLALNLAARRQFPEAVREAELAENLVPESFAVRQGLAMTYYYAGRYDDAIALCRRSLSIDGNPWMHGLLEAAYEHKQMEAQADAESRAWLLSFDSPVLHDIVQTTIAMRHKKQSDIEDLPSLVEKSRHEYVPAIKLAELYSLTGEADPVYEWLEKAIQQRDGGLVWLRFYGFQATDQIEHHLPQCARVIRQLTEP